MKTYGLTPDDADDCFSNVVANVLTAGVDIELVDNLRAYLIRCATNQAIDLIRKRERKPERTLHENFGSYYELDVDGYILTSERAKLVMTLLSSRETLIAEMIVDNYTFPEIASETRQNLRALKSV